MVKFPLSSLKPCGRGMELQTNSTRTRSGGAVPSSKTNFPESAAPPVDVGMLVGFTPPAGDTFFGACAPARVQASRAQVKTARMLARFMSRLPTTELTELRAGLEQACRPLAAADAHGHDAQFRLAPPHFVGKGADQARSRHAERMTDRHRSAVHVQLRRIDP